STRFSTERLTRRRGQELMPVNKPTAVIVVAIAILIGPGMSGGRPGSAQGGERESERGGLLERVGGAAGVQIYADGFSEVSLHQKVLIWHLYRAALAGRDIYYDQRYVHGLTMRGVMEAILTHPEGVDAETLTEIRRYTKLFWLNSGPYNHLTARK